MLTVLFLSYGSRADRVHQYRTKEDDTMAMLRNLAASRGYGPQ